MAKPEEVVYTFVYCGVEERGLSFYGYKSYAKAKEDAKRHYRREMERISLALEALDSNNVRVQYRRGGKFLSAGDAVLIQEKHTPPQKLVDAQ
jgi:hypothetical protein